MLEKSHDNDEMRTDDLSSKLIRGQSTGLEMHFCLAGAFSMDIPAKSPTCPAKPRKGSAEGPSRRLGSHVCGQAFS